MAATAFERESAGHALADVRLFNKKFKLVCPAIQLPPGHISQQALQDRISFIEEELKELKRAAASQDLAEIADALVDLDYVIKGTAVMMNLPYGWLWGEVQDSNMRKIPKVSVASYKRGIGKPDGWVKPRMGEILAYFGYDSSKWLLPGSTMIDESKCYDRIHDDTLRALAADEDNAGS